MSSEDSEETSCFLYDSDDSGEVAKTSVPPGEMDLLGEILDSLSTHSSDQGKLSGAKSLDFFRSMDDIDYKATVSYPTPCVSSVKTSLHPHNLLLVIGAAWMTGCFRVSHMSSCFCGNQVFLLNV